MLTMSDIALKVGVSRTTVSVVLTGRQEGTIRVSNEMRQRILDVAEEFGYRPNQLARSVRSGKSTMIGYLVNEPSYEPYWNTIIGALDEAEKQGFTLKVLSATTNTLPERIQQCIELRLSGLIVRMSDDKSVLFAEANAARIPLVIVDEVLPQPFGARISANESLGSEDAISHLVGFGHRRIGCISSGFQRPNGMLLPLREETFRQAMAIHGLEVLDGYVTYESMLVYGDHRGRAADTARAATEALLHHPSGRPTAIFCWRDETAMIAIRTCQLQGLRVPEDISIVGFSNIGGAWLFSPSLTTVIMPWQQIGGLAVRQLTQQIGKEFDPSPTTHLVPTGFVARDSSGPAPS